MGCQSICTEHSQHLNQQHQQLTQKSTTINDI